MHARRLALPVLAALLACSDSSGPSERPVPDLAGRWVGDAAGLHLELILGPASCPLGCGGTATGTFTYAPGALAGSLSSGSYMLGTPTDSGPALAGMLWEVDDPPEIYLHLSWAAVLTSESTLRATVVNEATAESPLRNFQTAITLTRQ